MGELLVGARQPETHRDITRVHGYRRRMAGRVAIPCVKGGDQGCREREVRLREFRVCLAERIRSLSLLSIKEQESLGSNGWNGEERDAPRRNRRVRVGE